MATGYRVTSLSANALLNGSVSGTESTFTSIKTLGTGYLNGNTSYAGTFYLSTTGDVFFVPTATLPSAASYTISSAPGSSIYSATAGAAANVGDQIDGTSQDDTIYGDPYANNNTTTGSDTLTGAGGNDYIFGGAGNDAIYGGAGDDYIYSGAGDDEIYGGNGDDTIDSGDGDDEIYGGNGDDLIYGGNGNDEIYGGNGDDQIYGGDGDDEIYGGNGDDEIYGGDGNDILYGGVGNDQVYGGAGDDEIHGGDGNDALYGGEGSDTIYGGEGDDEIHGDEGDDLLYGGMGNDTIYGGTGNDTIFGGDGDNLIYGGTGSNLIYGGAGNDTVYGGEGQDTIHLGEGVDYVYGGDDQDVFIIDRPENLANFGSGSVIDGGSGGLINYDTIDLTAWNRSDARIEYDPDDIKSGTITFYDSDGNIIGTITFSEIENIMVTCFTPGSMAVTDRGPVDVQDLQPGDRVLTRDQGFQEIVWVGAREISADGLRANPTLRGVRIAAGALGPGCPARDMVVSPQHRILVADPKAELLFDESEVLVPAIHMVGRPGITRADDQDINYIHFMCREHQVVMVDGCWSESYQPGAMTLAGMPAAQRTELLTLFPELIGQDIAALYPAARATLKRREAAILFAA